MRKGDWQSRRRTGLFLLIAASVIIIDQLTKLWIRSNLPLGASLPEEGFFRLTHVQNTGAAFGLLANQGFLLIIITLVGLLVIILLYRQLRLRTTLSTTALALIFGGAVGNLIDRLSLGYVTDFIDIRLWGDFHWQAFNLADSSITIGIFVLIYFLFWSLRKGGSYIRRVK